MSNFKIYYFDSPHYFIIFLMISWFTNYNFYTAHKQIQHQLGFYFQLFYFCLAGSLPEDSSIKGSIIIGPDGETINVGGHIDVHARPEQQHIENVGDANRYFGRGKTAHGYI